MKDKKETTQKEGLDVKVEDTLKNDRQKTCFVMMPIADVDRYPIGHFSRVYEYIIKPACIQAGFEPTLASHVKAANIIMIDILERLLNADMTVCDISDRNANVLYELGLRQAFDLPVTLIKDDITTPIFDILGIRYVEYNHQLRIDLVSETVKKLSETITETYEKKGLGTFSLVQMLGRDKAKVQPSTISDDTKILLEAINAIRINNSQKDFNTSLPSIRRPVLKSYGDVAYQLRFTGVPGLIENYSNEIKSILQDPPASARDVYFTHDDKGIVIIGFHTNSRLGPIEEMMVISGLKLLVGGDFILNQS